MLDLDGIDIKMYVRPTLKGYNDAFVRSSFKQQHDVFYIYIETAVFCMLVPEGMSNFIQVMNAVPVMWRRHYMCNVVFSLKQYHDVH